MAKNADGKSLEDTIGSLLDGGDAEPEAPAEEAIEAAPEPTDEVTDDAPAEETAEEQEARERDERGRFTKAEEAAKAKPAQVVKPAKLAATPQPQAAAQVEAAKAPGADLKPPQSWTAAARETWASVPPAARQEIHRLEGETRRVLEQSAQIRRERDGIAERYQHEAGFRQQVLSGLQPFEGVFRAQGMDPVQGAMSVVQTYGALHYGSREQKAGILAGLINSFSNVDDVNAVLQGQVQPQPFRPAPIAQQQPQPQVDVRALVQEQLQTLAQQAQSTKADQELEAFLGTQPEFIRDVWDEMQAVLDAAHARGRRISYQDAYDRALKLNDDVQSVLAQRQAAEAARAAGQRTARARVAASSVRTSPTVAAPARPKSDHDAVAAAWDELEGR